MTVRVRVKPEAYPTEVRVQMRKIESGNFKAEDIDLPGAALGVCEEDRDASAERDLRVARQHHLHMAGSALQGSGYAKGQRLQGGTREIACNPQDRRQRREVVKNVVVLGPGSKRCETRAVGVLAEADRLGVAVGVEKVADYARAVLAQCRRPKSSSMANCAR